MNEYITAGSAIVAFISAIAAVISVTVTLKKNKIDRNLHEDQEIVSHAILSLERAYEALMVHSKDNERPIPDRLNWLTSARQIESYKKLKSKLVTGLYKDICDEHEEYWRHKIHLALEIPSIDKSPSYYQSKSATDIGIEPRSALIIYSFASWGKNKKDIIDEVDIDKLISDNEPFTGNHGLIEYIKSFKDYAHLGKS